MHKKCSEVNSGLCDCLPNVEKSDYLGGIRNSVVPLGNTAGNDQFPSGISLNSSNFLRPSVLPDFDLLLTGEAHKSLYFRTSFT